MFLVIHLLKFNNIHKIVKKYVYSGDIVAQLVVLIGIVVNN